MVDKTPDQPVEIIETAVPLIDKKTEEAEPQPPAPFEYVE
jgi:hypothetical protein